MNGRRLLAIFFAAGQGMIRCDGFPHLGASASWAGACKRLGFARHRTVSSDCSTSGLSVAVHLAACKRLGFARYRTVSSDCSMSGLSVAVHLAACRQLGFARHTRVRSGLLCVRAHPSFGGNQRYHQPYTEQAAQKEKAHSSVVNTISTMQGIFQMSLPRA